MKKWLTIIFYGCLFVTMTACNNIVENNQSETEKEESTMNEIVATTQLISKANKKDTDYQLIGDPDRKQLWTFSHSDDAQEEKIDYRYIGLDPDNYIMFNEETYRIIGVFDVSDGKDTIEKRIKIIRTEPIIGIYSKKKIENYSKSTIQEQLNKTYWNTLSSNARNYVADSLWYLGTTTLEDTAETMYQKEKSNEETHSWIGKIGLLYPSDYGFATSGGRTMNSSACANKQLSNWNSFEECPNNNWLSFYMQEGKIATITFNADNENEFFAITPEGNLLNQNINTEEIEFYPTLYLKSDVEFLSGDGTKENPYILKEKNS